MSNTFKPKLVILISGRGSNMQSIVKAIQENELNAEVSAVISNRPEAPGLTFAQHSDITTRTLDHKDFATRETFDQQLIELIDTFKPDYVVLAGFMRILSAEFVQHYANRLINIHPSLLPKFKGMHTHQRAIEAGETEHGATVHFVTEELDAGPVILQAKVPLMADDTEQTLAARVLIEEHKLYPDALRLLIQQHQS